MEQVHLKYGTSAVDFEIDGAKSVKYLYENKMRVIEDIKAEFLHCVTDGVIGTKPLKELIAPTDPVTIVISDMTRFWMRQDVICELLVKYLHDEMGVGYDQIAVVVALGTHRKNTAEDRRKLASEFVYDHVASVTDHDCDAPDLVYIGTTSFGTRVSVNPLAVGRKVICIGGTVHHLMAGYGGGRKSIVPGIASRETIRMNHERALDPEKPMTDVRVGSGLVENNPINLDMREAGAMVQVTFGINIVVDTSSRHSGILMQRGPPLPLESSELAISNTSSPCSRRIWFVILFLSYTTTFPGAMANVFEPSFHCSRSEAMPFLPPQ